MSDISELREWANNKIKLYDKMAVEAPHLYASDVSRSMLHQVVELCDKTAWHYPSKGEYPPLLEYVFCKLTDDTYEVGYYQGQIDGEPEWAFTCFLGDVVAWQYIVPPKENEK